MARNNIAIARDYKIEFSSRSRQLSDLGRMVPRAPRVPSLKVLPTLKVIGINVGLGVGSSLLFGLIGTWLKNWAAELSIRYDLERMPSKIQDELPRHRGKIASIQSRGKQAYANVTIAIVQGSTVPVGEGMSGDHAPVAELELVEISEDNLDLRNRKVQYTNQIVSHEVTNRFTSSFLSWPPMFLQ